MLLDFLRYPLKIKDRKYITQRVNFIYTYNIEAGKNCELIVTLKYMNTLFKERTFIILTLKVMRRTLKINSKD